MAYIGRPPEYGGYEKQVLTANGSTTTFALDYTVGSESSLFVSVAGIPQQPGTAYTLSGGGANIVFSVAPASTATVFVIFLGYAFDSGTLLGTGTITGQTSLGSQPASADAFLIYDDDASALKKVTYSNLIPTTHGDVSGPVSSTDDALAKFDSTTGKVLQNSNAVLTDAGVLTVSNVAATLDTAAQPNITSLGTIASLVATTADINAGTFDGIVGGTTPAAGTFTTFTSTGIDDNADAVAVTINSSEQVGIGTALPDKMLHLVGGDLKLEGTSAQKELIFKRTDATAPHGKISYQDSAGTQYWTVGSNLRAGPGWEICEGVGQGTCRVNVSVGGDVGIGTDTTVPGAKLHVAGTVKTTGQAYFADTTLTFDATQDWDVSTNQVCTLTLTANTTFDAPTNMIDGAFYSILMIQDGTGSRTASWNTVFKWAAATAPVLTTTASAKDIFVWSSDGTNMYEVGRQLNVS